MYDIMEKKSKEDDFMDKVKKWFFEEEDEDDDIYERLILNLKQVYLNKPSSLKQAKLLNH